VQNTVAEETLGYVAHLHPFLGVKPFVGAGGGTMRFKPTPNGGEGLQQQYRAVYYYDAGADKALTPNFGVRVAFRQLIYLAPDFGQNYLTITRRAITTEPTFGFYLRF
jgi:opacity protein-like surface antigen